MLAIVSTHPIQYQVPIWCALANDGRVPFEVWYLTDLMVEITRKDYSPPNAIVGRYLEPKGQ